MVHWVNIIWMLVAGIGVLVIGVRVAVAWVVDTTTYSISDVVGAIVFMLSGLLLLYAALHTAKNLF